MIEISGSVSGEVAEDFEPVLEVFRGGASDLSTGGGAFAAYVEGERVVDLWAGNAKPGVPWERDTLATVMSATKGMAALCAQILYDRGELDPDARVVSYWPEFGQAGKREATVRQILTHTVGVLGFDDPGSLLDWEGRGWDQYEEIGIRLAAAQPAWEPGTAIGYHAVSFGWLLGELVRRRTGKTIGEFFRDEIAKPLNADVWIGTPAEEQLRLADVVPESYRGAPDEAVAFDRFMREEGRRVGSAYAEAFVSMHGTNILDELVPFMNQPRVRTTEIAASNGSATARGLAAVYAALSMGGELAGTRIASPESIRVFSVVAATGNQFGVSEFRLPNGTLAGVPMSFALGYAPTQSGSRSARPERPSGNAFGHGGAGGQVGFCDPASRVAVGYVRNQLAIAPTFSDNLISSVYGCLRLK